MISLWIYYIQILLICVAIALITISLIFVIKLAYLHKKCNNVIITKIYKSTDINSNSEHATNSKFAFTVFIDKDNTLYEVRRGIKRFNRKDNEDINLHVSNNRKQFYCDEQIKEDKKEAIVLLICGFVCIIVTTILKIKPQIIYETLRIILTMLVVVIGGILDHCCIKTNFFQKHKYPIDFKKEIRGKRIFGDNKTWIGLISMIISCIVATVIYGIVLKYLGIEKYSDIYIHRDNTLLYNIFLGFMIGLIYELCELPNSFLKRQFDIKPGLSGKGFIGKLFFIIDQIDSMIGLSLVLYFISHISIQKTIIYIICGGIMHCIVDISLYYAGLRKNKF